MKLLCTVIIFYVLFLPDTLKAQTLEAGPVTAFPVADLYESNIMGYGGSIRFMYPLLEDMNVHLKTGYIHFPENEDYPTVEYNIITDISLEHDVVPIQTGVSFQTTPGIFIDLYAGIHIWRSKETIDFSYYRYVEDTTEVKFSLGFGAGCLYDFSSSSGITVSAEYQWIQQSGSSLAYIALHAAYLYRF